MSMKKIATFLLALMATAGLYAQGGKNVVRDGGHPVSRLDQVTRYQDESILTAKNVAPSSQTGGLHTQGAQAVTAIELGRASNAYTILRPEQNQVYADPTSDLVLFIHRQDVTIWGGGGAENGKLRFDVSTDNGATFSSDIGVLNATYSRPSRYPNITGYNPTADSNPFNTKLVYAAPTLDPSPSWDGMVTGIADVTATNPATATETYSLIGEGSLLAGGLCEGASGEFWAVDFSYNGSATTDSIFVYKGTYNTSTQDVDWVTSDKLVPDWYTGYDGTATYIGPNVSFSPDGSTGWIGLLGDLNGGADTTLSPVFIKSTDGGATWGNAMEVNLDAVAWIKDSLQSLWIDSLGNPASSGYATTSFDFDITVDANGNPHMFTIIGSAAPFGAVGDKGYSIYSGLAKFAADIYSTDGGSTWEVAYIAPVLTFRGEFGTPDSGGSLLAMDNQPQVGRSADGNNIFYSWVDSDTTVVGFGESNNLAPNLRTSSMRITDGYMTLYSLVTDGDLLWDGRILYPTMSPIMLDDGSGNFNQPIVFLEMIANDQLQPCKFWYLGNDVAVTGSDYYSPSDLSLAWPGLITSTVDPIVAQNVTLFQSFPNPTSDVATIRFDLAASYDVSLEVVNMYGQTVATLAEGMHGVGLHEVKFSTSELAPGVYFYNLRAGGEVFTKKMTVVK